MAKGSIEALVEKFKRDADALLADMVAEAFGARRKPRVVGTAIVKDARQERLEQALSAKAQAKEPRPRRKKAATNRAHSRASYLRKKREKGTLKTHERVWLAAHEARHGQKT